MHNKNPLYLSCGFLTACFLVWFGFGTEYAKVNTCQAIVTKKVTAEFSEVTSSLNADGTISTDIDSWSEDASPTYKVVTDNGDVSYISHNFDLTRSGDVYWPPMPKHDPSFSRDLDFDNFKYRTDSTLKVYTTFTISGEPSVFTEPVSRYGKCLNKLQNYIQVKTWYGISYSSDF